MYAPSACGQLVTELLPGLFIHVYMFYDWLLLALFPSLPVFFYHFTVCKNKRGRSGLFYHVNDINVYLDRQRV